MSTQIDVARVQQYKANVMRLYQQKGSKLKGLVREESVTGKVAFVERLGATAAVKRTVRHSDTPLVDSPHTRRMVTMSDYEWADLVDDQDKIRMLISPESSYAINAADALGRAYDDEVIAAFDADAASGETGATAVTFASEKAGDDDFSGAALTLQNLILVKKNLDVQDVPADGRVLVISPAALYQLLKQTGAGTPVVASADYFNIKALVQGDVDSVLGFKVVSLTRLPSPAANMRYCYAFHRDSMVAAVGKEITSRMSERDDKGYSLQVYVNGTFGATRVLGNGVSRFKINETN